MKDEDYLADEEAITQLFEPDMSCVLKVTGIPQSLTTQGLKNCILPYDVRIEMDTREGAKDGLKRAVIYFKSEDEAARVRGAMSGKPPLFLKIYQECNSKGLVSHVPLGLDSDKESEDWDESAKNVLCQIKQLEEAEEEFLIESEEEKDVEAGREKVSCLDSKVLNEKSESIWSGRNSYEIDENENKTKEGKLFMSDSEFHGKTTIAVLNNQDTSEPQATGSSVGKSSNLEILRREEENCDGGNFTVVPDVCSQPLYILDNICSPLFSDYFNDNYENVDLASQMKRLDYRRLSAGSSIEFYSAVELHAEDSKGWLTAHYPEEQDIMNETNEDITKNFKRCFVEGQEVAAPEFLKCIHFFDDKDDLKFFNQSRQFPSFQSIYCRLTSLITSEEIKLKVRDLTKVPLVKGDKCFFTVYGKTMDQIYVRPLETGNTESDEILRLDLAMRECLLLPAVRGFPDVGDVVSTPKQFLNDIKYIRAEVVDSCPEEGSVELRGIDYVHNVKENVMNLRHLPVDVLNIRVLMSLVKLENIPAIPTNMCRDLCNELSSKLSSHLLQIDHINCAEKGDASVRIIKAEIERPSVNDMINNAILQFNRENRHARKQSTKNVKICCSLENENNKCKPSLKNKSSGEDKVSLVIFQMITDDDELILKMFMDENIEKIFGLPLRQEASGIVLNHKKSSTLFVVPFEAVDNLISRESKAKTLAEVTKNLNKMPEVGMVYLGLSGTRHWYRFLALKVNIDYSVRVFSLDFGFFDDIPFHHLKKYSQSNEELYLACHCLMADSKFSDSLHTELGEDLEGLLRPNMTIMFSVVEKVGASYVIEIHQKF